MLQRVRRRIVLSVVGTRPNLMKIAPIAAELLLRPDDFEHVIVHTDQHYDYEMSEIFVEQLALLEPDYRLEVGSGTHGYQTARVLEKIEPILEGVRPDIVLVPGDVNSTLGAALAAAKLSIPIGHVEAGLRSFDRSMPEEINRVLTDQLADLLFTHSPEAKDNLVAEGRPSRAVHEVGNTMIDSLVALRARIEASGTVERLGLDRGRYVVVTLHRPALVDTELIEGAILELERLAEEIPIVFPVHPRTRRAMEDRDLKLKGRQLLVLGPLGYLEFLDLLRGARAALTDSGGIQEETTFLGVPCFTLRDTTERPVTIQQGTNMLLGLDPARIADLPDLIVSLSDRSMTIPPGWDGRAAKRIVDVLAGLRR
jgi:UDP-N-acetylglucosamine 2-epimerase (non-hydrolysing)